MSWTSQHPGRWFWLPELLLSFCAVLLDRDSPSLTVHPQWEPGRDSCPPLPVGTHHSVMRIWAPLFQSPATSRSGREMIKSRMLEYLQGLEEDSVMHRNVLIAGVDAWDTLRLGTVHIHLHFFYPLAFSTTCISPSLLSLQLTLLFSY